MVAARQRIDLVRHLEFFVAVAEELHFGRVADVVGVSQPPLSQGLQRLERRLGRLLFDRGSGGVRLTPAGKGAELTSLTTRDRTPGLTGISAMLDPVTMSWRDLASLMMTVSDNAAADAILERVGVAQVVEALDDLGLFDTRISGGTATPSDCCTSTPVPPPSLTRLQPSPTTTIPLSRGPMIPCTPARRPHGT
jgi:hypothetical protein